MINSIPNSVYNELEYIEGYKSGYLYIVEDYGDIELVDEELMYLGMSDNSDYVSGFQLGAKDAYQGLSSKY